MMNGVSEVKLNPCLLLRCRYSSNLLMSAMPLNFDLYVKCNFPPEIVRPLGDTDSIVGH